MSFFETTHCQSGAHCGICRALIRGQDFRASVSAAWGCSPHFVCPRGRPWLRDFEAAAPALQPYIQAAAALSGDSPEARLLRAFTGQLAALSAARGSCSSGGRLAARCAAKLAWYFARYTPPAMPLQKSCSSF